MKINWQFYYFRSVSILLCTMSGALVAQHSWFWIPASIMGSIGLAVSDLAKGEKL